MEYWRGNAPDDNRLYRSGRGDWKMGCHHVNSGLCGLSRGAVSRLARDLSAGSKHYRRACRVSLRKCPNVVHDERGRCDIVTNRREVIVAASRMGSAKTHKLYELAVYVR